MISSKKNILVTGANGFIGKYLVEYLNKMGYNVISISSNDGDIETISLPENNIDYIFHLAALTFVPKSWEEPGEYYRVNVMGMVNVLECAKKNNCCITVPSTYMYGNPAKLPISENMPLNSYISPYHHSKGIAEDLCKFYSNQLAVGCTIMRVFNVYGYGQNPTFLISKLIQQLMDDSLSEIVLYDLEPKRDYVYIKDVVNALVLSMKNVGGLHVYNVGSGKSISVGNVAKDIMKCFGIWKKVVSLNKRRNNEIMETLADITLIGHELLWQPKYSLEEGLLDFKKYMNIE